MPKYLMSRARVIVLNHVLVQVASIQGYRIQQNVSKIEDKATVI